MVSTMRGGGSERQVLLLSNLLDRSRFAPHLYLTEAAGDFLAEVPGDVPIHSYDRDGRSGSRADGLAGRLYVPGRELRRQTAFLEQVLCDHHIDVVYDRTFHMTLLAGIACRNVAARRDQNPLAKGDLRRISTIVSPPHLAVPVVEKRFVSLKRRRLAAAYRASAHVVAVSRQAADSAESYYGLPANSVRVIKNPVEADAMRSMTHAIKPAPDVTTLAVVGRMTEEKGHADLIDALPSVCKSWPASRPPLQVRLIGDGALRDEILTRVRNAGLEQVVTFVGHHAQPWQEIAAADALVLPSRFEGMPNVVLEAMAIGTPVIATRAGGTSELQSDEPTAFWASPGDSKSLADAILRFATDPQQALKQRDAASRLVDAEHAPDLYAREIAALLDQ